MNDRPGGDCWRPAAGLESLRLRARLKGRIRRFFDSRDLLEVDTPILSTAAATDPQIESLRTRIAGDPRPRYLQTSPEFPMKRLLAADTGDCWQLARVFRDGERGRLHCPEFDLLEWYRIGMDHHRLMDEVADLVRATVAAERTVPAVSKLSYRDAFVRYVGLDPLASRVSQLRRAAEEAGVSVTGLDPDDRDGWLDALLTGAVVPALPSDRLVFIHAWPASQAALARLESGDPAVACRFELYWDGIELANGYHELADAAEQRARFATDLERRRASAGPAVPADGRLLAALETGLPDCAGVALGFDRLVLLAAGAGCIDAVLAFPPERA